MAPSRADLAGRAADWLTNDQFFLVCAASERQAPAMTWARSCAGRSDMVFAAAVGRFDPFVRTPVDEPYAIYRELREGQPLLHVNRGCRGHLPLPGHLGCCQRHVDVQQWLGLSHLAATAARRS